MPGEPGEPGELGEPGERSLLRGAGPAPSRPASPGGCGGAPAGRRLRGFRWGERGVRQSLLLLGRSGLLKHKSFYD